MTAPADTLDRIQARLREHGSLTAPGIVQEIRSRPVETIALHWDGTAQAAATIRTACDEAATFYRKVAGIEQGDDYVVSIETNNGPVAVAVGCWILWSGSDWYPCDPETFARRWEPVDA